MKEEQQNYKRFIYPALQVQYDSESLSSPISTWRLCGSWLFLIDPKLASDSLEKIPDNIAVSYLSGFESLSKKVLEKGLMNVFPIPFPYR
jgi:hypothetical protein